MPPSLAGSAKRSRLVSFGGGLPVSAGDSFVPIMTSRVPNIRGGMCKVGPFVCHPMRKGSMCCMWLAMCDGGKGL